MYERTHPHYIKTVVGKKPKKKDQKDIRIRQLIEGCIFKVAWAREAFSYIRQLQVSYLQDMILHESDADYVHSATQNVLSEIAERLRSEVEEGFEYLDELPKGQPVLLMTNHFGMYKLSGINPQIELGEVVPHYDGYDFMYPYPLYFAAFYGIAKILQNGLYYVSNDFPGIFGDIHTKAGFVHVPPKEALSNGRTELLVEENRQAITKRPNSVIVNFPEGGTSGKYNEGGPYDLLPFKTGGYVIAALLQIPIIPVAQFFDPYRGVRLKIFKPFRPNISNDAGYKQYAHNNQKEIQDWLTTKEKNASK